MNHVLLRAVAVFRFGKEKGIAALLRLIGQKLSGRQRDIANIDVLDSYGFIPFHPVGTSLLSGEVSRNTINWFIPYFGKGSGGHLNIFRFIYHLEELGFDCSIVIIGEPSPASAMRAEREIKEWFFPVKATVYLGLENAPAAHITVATAWQTAYAVRNFLSTNHRCYFVQDFEPWFYAVGSDAAFAEQTYRFGFVGITAGNWLKEKLASEYGMVTHAVGFSYDRERYRPLPRRGSTRQVFFYARPPTPRRAFELGVLVLNEVARRLPDVRVVFAGWDISAYRIPFEHLNAGTLTLDELPELYSQCDVALVLSLSNLSLLPLELMACGLPVVSNNGPHTEWLLNSSNAQLAGLTVEDLADAVIDLLENKEKREQLRLTGIACAKSTSWEDEACRMAEVFRGLDDVRMRADP
jgi:glycosyltransferase involved in cell wall biosynthesis